MAGIVSTGFVKKTLAEVVVELGQAYQNAFGSSLNLRPPSIASVQIGIAAEREAAIWDLAEEAYLSRAASTAQGAALDDVGDLTAQPRLEATASLIIDQYLFGDAGTVIDSSFIASVSGNASAKFSPKTTVILGAGTNCVQTLTFSAVPTTGTWTITLPNGQTTAALAYNANATAIQAAINALTAWAGVTVSGTYGTHFTVTFAGTSGLQPQIALVATPASLLATATPVTITPAITTPGVAQGVATMVCKTTGVIVAPAGLLSVIETPVTGLSRTFNFSDATPGRADETDAEYRIRRQDEIKGSGKGTVEAIRTKLKLVPDVLEAIVFQNTTLTTDGNGLPGKSVRAYVDGGAAQAIGDALWLAVGGGIQTTGDVAVSVTDSQGVVQSLAFSRPTIKNVYLGITITPTADYPATGDADVLAAILAYGSTLKIGQDVTVRASGGLLSAIVDAVAGIADIAITLGFSSSPVGTTNLAIAVNERAAFDSSRVVISS